MLKKIAIFGAGGFGREVLMLIHQINDMKPQWDFVGFFDDGIERGKKIDGYPVLGGVAEANAYPDELCLSLAIGVPATKKAIVQKLTSPRIHFPKLIHPGVQIAPYQFLEIGDGAIVCAGTVLTTNIRIGRHVILNLNCTVGHDTVIQDYGSFMPAVNISGEVKVGEGVYCGTAASIINLVEVGAGTVIGAGAVVSKSLPAHCTAVGVPAKPIKFHQPMPV